MLHYSSLTGRGCQTVHNSRYAQKSDTFNEIIHHDVCLVCTTVIYQLSLKVNIFSFAQAYCNLVYRTSLISYQAMLNLAYFFAVMLPFL